MSLTNKVQVLIIEDENTMTIIGQLKMQSSACEITVVRSSVEAANELMNKKYDLVLMDWETVKAKGQA